MLGSNTSLWAMTSVESDGYNFLLCILIRLCAKKEILRAKREPYSSALSSKGYFQFVDYLGSELQAPPYQTKAFHPSLSHLYERIRSVVTSLTDQMCIFDQLQHDLTECTQSMHAFHETFDDIAALIAHDNDSAVKHLSTEDDGHSVENLFSRSSIFGTFLCRVFKNWNQTHFDGLMRLYDQLVLVRNGQNLDLEGKKTIQESCDEDGIAGSSLTELSGNLLSNEGDWSYVLSEKCQARTAHSNEILDELYREYTYHVRDRDFPNALDSLHQYHDHAMRAKAQQSQKYITSGCKTLHDTDTASTQYAALNVAALQVSFHYYQNAIEHLQEAVRLAQHQGDVMCVLLALAWQVKVQRLLGKNHSVLLSALQTWNEQAKALHVPVMQMLQKLTALEISLDGSTDRSQHERTASHLQVLLLANNPRVCSFQVWLHLDSMFSCLVDVADTTEALQDPLNRNATMQRRFANSMMATMKDNDKPKKTGTGLGWITSSDDTLTLLQRLTSRTYAITAELWQLSGYSSLSSVLNDIYLKCYYEYGSDAELAKVLSQLAYNQSRKTNSSCTHFEAIAYLVEKVASEHPTLADSHAFQYSVHFAFYEWALLRHEFLRARAHCNAMMSLYFSKKNLSSYIEARLCEAKWYGCKGEYSEALKLLSELEMLCVAHEWTYLGCKCKYLQFKFRCEAIKPQVPFQIIDDITSCLHVCHEKKFFALMMKLELILLDTYFSLEKWSLARSLLGKLLSSALEHGDDHLQGEVFLSLAKCEYAACIHRISEQPISFALVLEHLATAKTCFANIQDINKLEEVVYLQALAYHELAKGTIHQQNAESKNIAALEFLTLQKQQQTNRKREIESFFSFSTPKHILRVAHSRKAEV